VSYQAVSAKSGEHVDELLDLILLAADVMDLSYDPDAPASGFVLEARMDRRRGMEATVLVKNGTLKYGSPIATRSAQGKVKIFEDFTGKAVKELTPSAPAIVVGFEKLPQIGEEFSAGTLGELLGEVLEEKTGPREMPKDPTTLRLLLKADESGSLEALYGVAEAMKGKLPVAITGDAVGDITDGDVQFAVSTNSIILGFNTRVEKGAQALADVQKIKIVTSKIIYDLTRAIEETIKERSGPQATGIMEVLAVFNQTRMDKQLVGGKVISGQLKPKSLCIVKRGDKEVGKGRIITLREGKKEVTVVEGGKEAGIVLGASILIEQGDHIVAA
jgi:translation initiation factor IF-2